MANFEFTRLTIEVTKTKKLTYLLNFGIEKNDQSPIISKYGADCLIMPSSIELLRNILINPTQKPFDNLFIQNMLSR